MTKKSSNTSQHDELIEFLLRDDLDGECRYNFNQILINNKNNMQLSIMLFRKWLRCNTSRGRISCEHLEWVLENDIKLLRLSLDEMFLDLISEDMCVIMVDTLSKKGISCRDFHNKHIEDVDKPLTRLLSSL